METSLQRVPFGIPELDSVIEGGVPKGSLTLLAGTPGSGKTAFGAKFLYEGRAHLHRSNSRLEG